MGIPSQIFQDLFRAGTGGFGITGPFLFPDGFNQAIKSGKGAMFCSIARKLEISIFVKLFEALDVDALEHLDQGACPEKIILFGRGPLTFLFNPARIVYSEKSALLHPDLKNYGQHSDSGQPSHLLYLQP